MGVDNLKMGILAGLEEMKDIDVNGIKSSKKTYHTKCGREFKKISTATVTGYHIPEGDKQCNECPFRLEVKEGWPPVFKRWECRAGSEPPNQKNEWQGNLEDKTNLHIYSLHNDFLGAVLEYCQNADDLSAGYNQDLDDCRRVISVSCSSNKKGIAAKKALVEKFFSKTDSKTTAPEAINNIVEYRNSENKSSEIIAFDYSAVDADTAIFLHQKEQKITQIRMMSVMAIGRELKEAHDKLSNHYQGCFGKWCESIGMSRDTAENYIRAYKYVAENFGNIEEADQIQPSLLFAISRPSAPEELQKAVLDGDITTHKQYKELEAKLKAIKEEVEAKQQLYDTISKSYDRLEKKNYEQDEKAKRLEEELEKAKDQLLEAQSSENNIATAVVEKAPDEVLEELEKLRETSTDIGINAELKILLKVLNNNILSLGKVLSNIKENSSIAAECISHIEQVRENMILIKKISLEKFNRELFDFIKD